MTPPDPSPLGIIAGGGRLPLDLAAAVAATGRGVFVIGLEGHADPAALAPYPHACHRIGAAGAILDALREAGCREVVLLGTVRRPSLVTLRPDAGAARLIPRLGRAFFGGDDGLLSAVIRVVGEEGFTVRGAHELLPGTLAPQGLLTRNAPDAEARADIARGIAVARALGGVDVGQGCVVQQGLVLAVEAIEGTDAMLARAAALSHPGPGGVLVKLVKPGQDRRADLPTIGRATIRAAAAAGLRGIAYAAGATLLAEPDALAGEADAAGIFLLGMDPDTFTASGDEPMSRFLHTMLRVGDLQRSIDFYTKGFGMTELRRRDVPDGKYTLAFVGYGPEDSHSVIELTYNYGTDRYEQGTAFGHLAIGVPDVAATTEMLRGLGAKVTREPGPVKFGTSIIAFVEDPDGYKIELVQRA